MGIRFILMVNKQGQTRLAQYYEYLTLEERRALEAEIVRKCHARTEQQVSIYIYTHTHIYIYMYQSGKAKLRVLEFKILVHLFY